MCLWDGKFVLLLTWAEYLLASWNGLSYVEVVEHACGMASLQMGEYVSNVSHGIDTYSIREPLGVCAGICPFNFPAMIPLWVSLLSFTVNPSGHNFSSGELVCFLWNFFIPQKILELFSSFHPDIIPPNSLYFVFFSYDIRLTSPLDNPLQMFPIAVTCGNTFVLKPSEKDPGDHCFLIIPQITLIWTCLFTVSI